MLKKLIVFFGNTLTLACDGRCDKAWGINGRPKHDFDPGESDDYVWIEDSKLGTAPGPGETVGLSEGGQMKPSATALTDSEAFRMNKWCARECERSTKAKQGEEVVIKDLENPTPNMPHRRSASEGRHDG